MDTGLVLKTANLLRYFGGFPYILVAQTPCVQVYDNKKVFLRTDYLHTDEDNDEIHASVNVAST